MRVLLIEPYYGGSHRAWADQYQQHSKHHIDLLTLPDQFWKWRMQGGAVTLARLYAGQSHSPDVILASDMFNLATFRALTQITDIPIALYFHETQLTYPQNSRQKHGWQYAFVNYISALAADRVLFNSQYHLDAFFATLPNMLKHFADYNELQTVDTIRAKSSVLPPGLNLTRFDPYGTAAVERDVPIILWNHRWEEDKNPKTFFKSLYLLLERDIDFRVAITGENFRQHPTEFEAAKERLGERIIQYGYVASFADYARLLWQADYVVSTAWQEFFGLSVVEAVYCGCIPILPHRLNYPYLIPEVVHSACLYPGKALAPLLEKHLRGELSVDKFMLQAHVHQYDWSVLAAKYDTVLESLL